MPPLQVCLPWQWTMEPDREIPNQRVQLEIQAANYLTYGAGVASAIFGRQGMRLNSHRHRHLHRQRHQKHHEHSTQHCDRQPVRELCP